MIEIEIKKSFSNQQRRQLLQNLGQFKDMNNKIGEGVHNKILLTISHQKYHQSG